MRALLSQIVPTCEYMQDRFNLSRVEFVLNKKNLKCELTPWRNGSASDSRSEGCVFESRRGQYF